MSSEFIVADFDLEVNSYFMPGTAFNIGGTLV
jgi:hypothetical protein